MYPEFVPIYVMLGVAIALLAALIVLAILILKKLGNRPAAPARGTRSAAAAPAGGITCPGCGASLPAGTKFCSGCGSKIEAVPKKAQNTLEFRAEIHYNFTVPS